MPSPRVRHAALYATFACLKCTTPSFAEEAPASEALGMATVRTGLLYSGLIFIGDPRTNGLIQLFELTGSVRLASLFEMELGVHYWVDPCVHGPSLTPRLGVAPSVLHPPSGQGWELRIPILVGYDYAWLNGGGCDMNPDERRQSLVGSVGFEATIWGESIGFDFRLLPMFGQTWTHYELQARNNYEREPDSRFVYGGLTEFGITFPVY